MSQQNLNFTQEQQMLFRRYEQVKIQIKELEAQADLLKPQITPLIPDLSEIQGDYGVFIVQKRAKWKHSPAIEDMEANLKEEKAKEIAKGIAVPTYSDILVYKTVTLAEDE